MKILSLKCPQCGASLDSEKSSFCSYCGTRLYLDDGSKNININYKNEDVAKIKEIEVNKELELEKMKETHGLVEKFVLFAILVPAIIVLAIIIGAVL